MESNIEILITKKELCYRVYIGMRDGSGQRTFVKTKKEALDYITDYVKSVIDEIK